MSHNAQKQPYSNRTNFVYSGARACQRGVLNAFRACKKSGKFLFEKSSDYNRKFKRYIKQSFKKKNGGEPQN